MGRIVLIGCVIFLVSFHGEMVLATQKYDPSSGFHKAKSAEKTSETYLISKLGRKKRNVADETYILSEQELAQMWDLFGETPTALITINGNEKFICKTMQDFVPRLGRNLDEAPGSEKWLREAIVAEEDERSPPFAPRLGRRLSQLGKDV